MKDLNKMLGSAIYIATESHYKQFDKSGKPYILHPLHLMNQFMWDLELAMIAVLHDTIEDCESTNVMYLYACGFSKRVVEAVDCLTHKDDEGYSEYIERICENYDAVLVKRKDLEHNSDITRLKGITQKDLNRMEKYHKAFLRLGVAKKGFQNK